MRRFSSRGGRRFRRSFRRTRRLRHYRVKRGGVRL